MDWAGSSIRFLQGRARPGRETRIESGAEEKAPPTARQQRYRRRRRRRRRRGRILHVPSLERKGQYDRALDLLAHASCTRADRRASFGAVGRGPDATAVRPARALARARARKHTRLFTILFRVHEIALEFQGDDVPWMSQRSPAPINFIAANGPGRAPCRARRPRPGVYPSLVSESISESAL